MREMARRVKFALEMKDGFQARNSIEEIREHFDYGKIIVYLHDGRLQRWLEDRGYEAEAVALGEVDINAPDVKEEVCHIFRVDSDEVEMEYHFDMKAEVKLIYVRQYTDDENILSKISHVATNQEELAELNARNIKEIYLCGREFTISPYSENVKYIGLGDVNALFSGNDAVDLEQKNICFRNVNIDKKYLCDIPKGSSHSNQKNNGNAEQIVSDVRTNLWLQTECEELRGDEKKANKKHEKNENSWLNMTCEDLRRGGL